MMRTLTFVRHAESVANAGGITMPHESIPLSEFGHLQAQALAASLDAAPATVLVSAMLRTQQTAAPLCARFGVVPQVHPGLNEFSVIDPALIAGLDGPQRKPFVHAYWSAPDPHRRQGVNADTFAEFEARVCGFMVEMDSLPDAAVIVGHGIWLAMLHWLLLGYNASDTAGMAAFRRFQQTLPMPNCAAFSLTHAGGKRWSIQPNKNLMRRIADGDSVESAERA